ncbi:hypothetical protein B0H13DRAFT_2119119 [Mycena leptocephala]|nr:hypothetical protein B0H13DRAFT_2119119 [Mycena leptocephala]
MSLAPYSPYLSSPRDLTPELSTHQPSYYGSAGPLISLPGLDYSVPSAPHMQHIPLPGLSVPGPFYFSSPHADRVRLKNSYLQRDTQSALQIHPWLSGDSLSHGFSFDLASAQFSPMWGVRGSTRCVQLTGAELRQPAFHPPLTSLRIVHPQIPYWPIDLTLPAGFPAPEAPPISMGDVLVALHLSLHQSITQRDWARLGFQEEQAVTRAYAKRCGRSAEERMRGVKRVDFLTERTMFKGFRMAHGEGNVILTLVTASA